MARQVINTGSALADRSGDDGRTAFTKTNENFAELYTNHDRTAAETAAGVTPTNYGYEPGDVRRYGAVGDGSTDDTTAVSNAIASNDEVFGEPGDTYRITSKLTISAPTRISRCAFLFDFPTGTSTANGGLFTILSDDVTLDGVNVDGTGVSGTITGVNRYAVLVEPSGATRYSNICIQRCKFTNLTQISGSIPATTTVMHAISARQVDDLRVIDNVINNISGAGVYLRSTEGAKVRGNDFIKFGWSGVWLENDNTHADIDGNTFSGTTAANPSYWGGAIDVMGQTSDAASPGNPDEHVTIRGNKFIGGVYRYGAVVRLSSTHNAVVDGNLFDQCNADDQAVEGGGGVGSHNHYIVATVRDVTVNNGPHKFLTITNNIFRAKGAGWQIAINLITTSGTGVDTNLTPCQGVLIEGNQFESVDGSNFFQSAVTLHGFSSGYSDVVIRGNNIKCTPNSVANYMPASLPGAVVLIANSGKTVRGVTITDNTLERFAGAGTGNNDTGVNVYSDVTDVVIRDNIFYNFFRDVTVNASNAGTVPVLENLHNRAAGGTDWNLRGVALNTGFASAAYDPASLADGAGATTTVTVTGARIGDAAECSFSLDLQGILLTAYVSADNTVSARFQNETGGVIDLGSGTLRARVRKTA